jgi:outer membrane lipoprotein-sorting protein
MILKSGEKAMKKRICSLSITGVFLLALMAPHGFGQSTKRILKRMLDAGGGKKVYESIVDLTMSGSMEIAQQKIKGTLTMYKKEPDKRRIDLEALGMVIVQAYDGHTARWTNPQTGSVEEMSEQDALSLARQSLPLVAIIEPEKYGITFTYKGKERVGDRDYHLLEQAYKDGYTMLRYVDAGSYLTEMTRSTRSGPEGTEIQVEQRMSDFKEVGGMILAHSIVTYYNGEVFSKITLKEVKFNTGLDDSLFWIDK